MWDAFCEHLRNCGRSGHLFVFVMLLIFVGALFGLPGVGALIALLGGYLLWFLNELRRHQDRFERLGHQPPLAAVDLRTARSRLAKSHTQRLALASSQRARTQRLGGPSSLAPQPGAASASTQLRATSSPLRLRPR